MNGSDEKREGYILSLGIVLGAGFGVALGVVLMNALHHPGMYALGLAIGLSCGTTIGLVLERRQEGEDHVRH